MTQNLAGHAEPHNIAKQVWLFCVGCGLHMKSTAYRAATKDNRCDACVPTRRHWRAEH